MGQMVNGWLIEEKNGFFTATNAAGRVGVTSTSESKVMTWALSHRADR